MADLSIPGDSMRAGFMEVTSVNANYRNHNLRRRPEHGRNTPAARIGRPRMPKMRAPRRAAEFRNLSERMFTCPQASHRRNLLVPNDFHFAPRRLPRIGMPGWPRGNSRSIFEQAPLSPRGRIPL